MIHTKVLLPTELLEKVCSAARSEGMAVSTWIRRLIMRELLK